MDAIVSLEIEKLQERSKKLDSFKEMISGVFSVEILSFIASEVSMVVSAVMNDTYEKIDKKIRIAKAYGRLSGIENTINFLSIMQPGGAVPYSIQSLKMEIKLIENSIARILMNL